MSLEQGELSKLVEDQSRSEARRMSNAYRGVRLDKNRGFEDIPGGEVIDEAADAISKYETVDTIMTDVQLTEDQLLAR